MEELLQIMPAILSLRWERERGKKREKIEKKKMKEEKDTHKGDWG